MAPNRCIGGILFSLPATACLGYFRCLFNGDFVAPFGGYYAIAVSSLQSSKVFANTKKTTLQWWL